MCVSPYICPFVLISNFAQHISIPVRNIKFYTILSPCPRVGKEEYPLKMTTSEKNLFVDAYVRVSTHEQANEGYSIGAQTERLQAYCQARGWTLANVYTDPGFSGAKMVRPGLQKLISDVQNKRVDIVLVYKLDRLSRSQKDTLYLIEDVFMKNGVAFVSMNENFDTSTAFGRAMVGILSVFAQLEREQIKERTQMGRIERAKEGLWKGGGIVPIGYRYIESENELRINDYEAMQIRMVFDMFVNKGYALNRIQKELGNAGYRYEAGAWQHPKTVRYVLTNPIYIGLIQWQGELYQGKHKPIIEKDLFDKAQKRIAETSWRNGRPPDYSPFTATQLLSGIIFCKVCGGRYYGSGAYRGSKKLPYAQRNYIHIYTCYSRSKTKKAMIQDPNCKNKNWRSEVLDEKILSEIRKLYTNESYFDSLIASAPAPEDKRGPILERISQLDLQIGKMLDLYQLQYAPMEQIAERLEALTQEKLDLERSLEGLHEERPGLTAEQARIIIGNAKDVLENGTLDEKRTLLQSLIKRIDIEYENIYITWRFM